MVRIFGVLILFVTATGFAQDLPALPIAEVATETGSGPSEADRILAANPELVDRLLRRAAKGAGDEALMTLYCLGPSITGRLLENLASEDEATRAVAVAALSYVCAHEEGVPRPQIVKALLGMNGAGELDESVDEVLMFVVRSTRPEFRAVLRTAIEREMTDEIAGRPAPLRVAGTPRSAVAEPEGGLPFLYGESVENGERVVRVSWPVPMELREPAVPAPARPEQVLRGPADFFRDLPR